MWLLADGSVAAWGGGGGKCWPGVLLCLHGSCGSVRSRVPSGVRDSEGGVSGRSRPPQAAHGPSVSPQDSISLLLEAVRTRNEELAQTWKKSEQWATIEQLCSKCSLSSHQDTLGLLRPSGHPAQAPLPGPGLGCSGPGAGAWGALGRQWR